MCYEKRTSSRALDSRPSRRPGHRTMALGGLGSAVDFARAFRLILADGQAVECDAAHDDELFQAAG